jgi:hypothetical protein
MNAWTVRVLDACATACLMLGIGECLLARFW